MSDEVIDRFAGDYAFLSNFYPCPLLASGGVTYPTLEHAFQAGKSNNPDDWIAIANAPTPNQAKRLGRAVRMRPDWDKIKVGYMADLLVCKFTVQPFRSQLVATGNATLIEGNTWHDQYWGDCTCKRHSTERGRNQLGWLLMNLRLRLKASEN